jgi:MoxR-like ATPase
MGRIFLFAAAFLVALVVVPYALVFAAAGVLGLLALAGIFKLIRPAHPWFSLVFEYLTLKRGKLGLVAALTLGAGMGVALVFIPAGLVDIASGRHMAAGVNGFAAGVLLGLASLGWLMYVSRGDTMPQYLNLLGPGGLSAVRDAMAGAGAAPPGMNAPQDLADQLKRRVLGQDPIVDDVAATVARRLRLRRPNKPVAVLMFAGATGAGKTELAKALADALRAELVRIDCNELTESHSVQRLIGAPPGYVGSDQPGQLTGALARARQGVLLLDEIEKADRKVMDVLMGFLDEGRLTDQATGQTVAGDGFLVVMTSNAAHSEIAQIADAEPDPVARAAKVKDELQRFFRPEQLARIDQIYPFRPLPFEARVELVLMMLTRFAAEAGVSIVPGGVDPAAVAAALQVQAKVAGYGVREFQRTLEAAVMDGFLDAAASGARHVSIRVESNDRIDVEPLRSGSHAAEKGRPA